jgi:hypothetical protein
MRNSSIKTPKDVETFISQIKSIRRKFMESLITGQRDPIFGKADATPQNQIVNESIQSRVDSQSENL